VDWVARVPKRSSATIRLDDKLLHISITANNLSPVVKSTGQPDRLKPEMLCNNLMIQEALANMLK